MSLFFRRGLCGLLVLHFLAAPAFAADTLALSLDEAMALSQRTAPDVVIAERIRDEVVASRKGAGVVTHGNPTLYGEARPGITETTRPWDFGYAAQLGATFELMAPGARVAEAIARGATATAEVERERFLSRFKVWFAYIDAQLALEKVRAAEDAVVAARRTVDAAEQRAAAGASGDIDVYTARVELADFQARQAEEQSEREQKLGELAHLLDLDPNVSLRLTTDVQAPVAPPLLVISEERPELSLIRQRQLQLQKTQQLLQREALPKIGVMLGVDAAPDSPIFGQLGLSLELPFAQRNQGPRASNRAAQQTESERYSLEWRRIQREMIVHQKIFDARLREFTLLDRDALPAAQQNVALIETGWRLGRFDIFRLTLATRELHALRIKRSDVLLQAWRERILLELSRGQKS